jgi:glycine oxidase
VERYDAAIVGGGIIGLACAWRAAQHGLDVVVLERSEAGSGATRVAAGVLAPDPETPGFGELARRSAQLWPEFAAALGDVGYTQCGSLQLVFDREPRAVEGEWIDGDACRALEPGVAHDCTGGVLVRDDAQVDPRRVAAALAASLGDVVREGADVVACAPDRVDLADGSRIDAERVVLAAGAWTSRRLARLLTIRPVKARRSACVVRCRRRGSSGARTSTSFRARAA